MSFNSFNIINKDGCIDLIGLVVHCTVGTCNTESECSLYMYICLISTVRHRT